MSRRYCTSVAIRQRWRGRRRVGGLGGPAVEPQSGAVTASQSHLPDPAASCAVRGSGLRNHDGVYDPVDTSSHLEPVAPCNGNRYLSQSPARALHPGENVTSTDTEVQFEDTAAWQVEPV